MKFSQIVNLVVSLLFFAPKSKVLLEKLDDGLGVTEVVFLKLINLIKGVLERLVGEVTSGLVVLHGFIIEDGEVEGKTELDGIARGKGDSVGFVVSGKGLLLDLFEIVTLGVLSNVTVVVSDHLDEKGLGLTIARLAQNLGVDHVNNFLAVTLELALNTGFVGLEGISKLCVLGVLLNGSDGSASGSLGRD